jgi:hypothetical protein
MLGPAPIPDDPDVLPALRELFSQHPAMARSGRENLSRALFALRYLPYRPETLAVEAAREALLVEGEVLA